MTHRPRLSLVGRTPSSASNTIAGSIPQQRRAIAPPRAPSGGMDVILAPVVDHFGIDAEGAAGLADWARRLTA